MCVSSLWKNGPTGHSLQMEREDTVKADHLCTTRVVRGLSLTIFLYFLLCDSKNVKVVIVATRLLLFGLLGADPWCDAGE